LTESPRAGGKRDILAEAIGNQKLRDNGEALN